MPIAETSLTRPRPAPYQAAWTARQSLTEAKKWPLGLSVLLIFVASLVLWTVIGAVVWTQI